MARDEAGNTDRKQDQENLGTKLRKLQFHLLPIAPGQWSNIEQRAHCPTSQNEATTNQNRGWL